MPLAPFVFFAPLLLCGEGGRGREASEYNARVGEGVLASVRTSLPFPFGETFLADLPAGRALDFLFAGDGVDFGDFGDAFFLPDAAFAGLALGVCE